MLPDLVPKLKLNEGISLPSTVEEIFMSRVQLQFILILFVKMSEGQFGAVGEIILALESQIQALGLGLGLANEHR